jgi:hypothetical protein
VRWQRSRCIRNGEWMSALKGLYGESLHGSTRGLDSSWLASLVGWNDKGAVG